ncbi:MAG: transglutaminase domain-containing protein [Candidatus Heimdallarchaeota archaeon]|nr:transglutaminase domain-containing protein [Candidatus Heimdallarchaeota archaeon]
MNEVEVSKDSLDLKEFFKPTKSLDFNKSFVKNKALEIVKDAETETDKALSIFNWMKDNIKFSVSNTDAKASRTLKKGYGECANRTVLHVALLRAVGIPARMRYVDLKSELLQPIIPSFLFSRIPPKLGHIWPECYIDNKWISCETFYDTALYEKMLEKNMITKDQVPTINWDGKTDLILLKNWILEDKGSIDSFDVLNIKAQFIEKLIGPIVFKKAIQHTDKIRNEK